MLASWLVAWARIRLQRTSRRIELGGKVNGAQASQHGPALELPQPASASDRQTSVSRVQALLATLARFTDAVSRVCGSQQLTGTQADAFDRFCWRHRRVPENLKRLVRNRRLGTFNVI